MGMRSVHARSGETVLYHVKISSVSHCSLCSSPLVNPKWDGDGGKCACLAIPIQTLVKLICVLCLVLQLYDTDSWQHKWVNKQERRQRQLGQILIRGDSVVICSCQARPLPPPPPLQALLPFPTPLQLSPLAPPPLYDNTPSNPGPTPLQILPPPNPDAAPTALQAQPLTHPAPPCIQG